MSSKAFKLLERMRKSKKGWKRRDLDSLYEGFGFIIKPGGSHDLVKHPDYPEIGRTFLPRHNKLLEVYVTEAIKLIDRLIEIQNLSKTEGGSETGDQSDEQ